MPELPSRNPRAQAFELPSRHSRAQAFELPSRRTRAQVFELPSRRPRTQVYELSSRRSRAQAFELPSRHPRTQAFVTPLARLGRAVSSLGRCRMRRPLLLLACLCLCTETRGALRTTGGSRRGAGRLMGAAGDGALLRRSKRGWMWNQFFLLEEYTGSDDQYVGKLHSDKDREDGTVKYVLSGEGAGTIFVIDENSGDLHATRRLDREEKASYTLSAKAVDKLTGRDLEGPSQFTIKIHDINDNEPKFTRDPYTASVQEMADIGTFVVQVTATDADDATYGNSAKVVYSVLQGQPYFSVEPETGIIRTALPNMNRELREHYQVVIQAKDMAGQMGGLSGTTTVNISLLDINNNPPRFPQGVYQFSVSESSDPGTVIGTLMAMDADSGRNAEMEYTVMDAQDLFQITTNRRTQEGVVTLRKARKAHFLTVHLDYERRRTHSLRVQVDNVYLDPHFHSRDSFRDTATVKILVEDEDEPPVFKRPSYVMEVKEDTEMGTVIGTVSAVDPDADRASIRYLIDWRTDMDHVFNIHPNNGSIYISHPLDREERSWHNISVQAAEHNNMMSHVPVYIRVLDVNDNAPTFDTTYEPLVCENARPGQRVQTVSGSDADQPTGGHRFFFRLAPDAFDKANFTVIDNRDNTASIVTQRSGYSRLQRGTQLIPVVITDGEPPEQSSTATLTVRVCACDHQGDAGQCSVDAHVLSAGLSTGALVAVLLCVVILLLIVVLFTALRRQAEKMEPLIMSKEDVRDNVVSYNDEGGGEEDTQAFDIGTLRHPEVVEDSAHRRDVVPETLYPPRQWTVACDHNTDVHNFISQRLQENDCDPTAPPYDSLATYAYEGSGSVAESLSSLQTRSSQGMQDYDCLSDWGPRFKKLADMYGGEESDS